MAEVIKYFAVNVKGLEPSIMRKRREKIVRSSVAYFFENIFKIIVIGE